MELSDTSFGGTKVPWNSMECSMEFHGTKSYVIWRHQSSMEFHGIFHGIPWNTCVICNGALLIPWTSIELSYTIFGGTKVPWNSMECSMEFHWTKWYVIWRHQSSMEFHLKWRPPNSMESHGSRWFFLWFFIWRLQSFVEFCGIFLESPW